MIVTPLAAAAVLLWAGLCAADQRGLGARQIHQPLVAATVAGFLLGAPDRALLVGLWMQLVWTAPLPIGGAVLPDTGAAAVSGAVLVAVLPGGAGFAAAVLFALLASAASIPWERRLRAANERLDEAVLRGNGRGAFGRAILPGLGGPFLRGVALAALALAAGTAAHAPLAAFAASEPAWVPAVERGVIGGAAVVGIASLARRFRTEGGPRGAIAWMAGGAVLGVAGRILAGWIAR